MLDAPDAYRARRVEWLRELAEQSGGHEFVSQDVAQVADFVASIANPIVYQFRYQPVRMPPDGKLSPLWVNVVTAPAGSFKITTTYSNDGH
jgi:hypothetical protein